MRRTSIMLVTLLGLAVAACAGEVPQTHYYRLAPPEAAPEGHGPVLMVDELEVDAAYDDARIVYRTSPYELEYYEYHQWSAAPGRLVADFLRSGYESTGRFERVVRGFQGDAPVVLSGRVLAIEEVDRSRKQWIANVELELELRNATTNEVLWSGNVREQEPIDERSPEGLARALTRALTRVVRRTAPELAAAAKSIEPEEEDRAAAFYRPTLR